MALPDPLQNPAVLAVLTLVMVALLRYQRGLSWHEYRAIHRPKVRLFPILDRLSPGGFDSFVNDKGYRDDAEYLTTRDSSVKAVWRRLVDAGGSPHLISSIKRRETPTGATPATAAMQSWHLSR